LKTIAPSFCAAGRTSNYLTEWQMARGQKSTAQHDVVCPL
jgi:hypothetical protein